MFVIVTYAPICDCLKPTNQFQNTPKKNLAHKVTSSCFSSYSTSYIPTMLFMVFSVPILRRMLDYTNDQQPHHYDHLMTLGIQVHLLIYWH